MTNEQAWRVAYRGQRYLEHATPQELVQRLRDLLNNMVEITGEGKIGFVPAVTDGLFILIKFVHLLEEYELRGLDFPYDRMRDHALPSPMRPKRGRCNNHNFTWDAVLPELPHGAVVKYGKLKHLQEMISGGPVRIAPASSYEDPSLGPHRQDGERSRVVSMRPDGGVAHLVQLADGTQLDKPEPIEIIGNMTCTTSMDSDYYIFCTAGKLSPRLFVDFDADACLIIHDTGKFQQRLAHAMATEIWRNFNGPLEQYDARSRAVTYFDPLDPPKEIKSITVPWHKPLKYWYQREVRFAGFVAPYPTKPLQTLWVKLGPLYDIAELIYVGELDGRRFIHRSWPAVRSPATEMN